MGRPQREESPDVVKSKVFSYILRHGAEKEMLHVRSDGYIKVADLLSRPKCKDIDLPELLRLVKENAKQRFVIFYGRDPSPPVPKGKKTAAQPSTELPLVPVEPPVNLDTSSEASSSQSGEYFIRAAQGHTIALAETSDHLTPVRAGDEAGLAAVGEMVHGTTFAVWDQIRRTGLSRMERQHIHLAPARANHQITPRASSNLFIYLSLPSLLSASPPIPVFTAANGVVLSPGDRSGHIPAEHFSKVIRIAIVDGQKQDILLWSDGQPTEAGQALITKEENRLKRMPHSLHSHSGQFCRHAKDDLEDVVKEAIRKGFKTFGLSEHAPRYRVEDLYPEEDDLKPEQLLDIYYSFLTEARRLKEKYAEEIELLVGIETDHITPLDATGLAKVLKEKHGDIDYMVGSVHHVNGVPIDFDRDTWLRAVREADSAEHGRTMVSSTDLEGKPSLVPLPADLPKDYMPATAELLPFFNAYFDAQYQLLSTQRPEVIGHFDLCRLYMPNIDFKDEALPGVWSKIQRNIRFAAGYGALFELNAAAFRKGWEVSYPGPEIVELILACRGRFCLSDDSHGVHAVGMNYHRLRKYVLDLGLKELWCLARDPGGPKGKSRARRKTIPVLVTGKLDDDASWPKE